MAFDYEEGRRLLKAKNIAFIACDRWPTGIRRNILSAATQDLKDFLFSHAEALLNPDPWRPIEEATTDMPDNVKYVLAHKDDPEWICLADGPPEDGRWYSDGWHVEPTHFRELKGPGQ